MKKLYPLIKKEFFQIVRDPSSIMIAVILPLILLFMFGYGMNLDNNQVKIGLVVDDLSPDVTSLSEGFTASRFFNVTVSRDKRNLEELLIGGYLRGIVVIPQNFIAHLNLSDTQNTILSIADGSEPNIASFLQSYVQGVMQGWLNHQKKDRNLNVGNSLISIDSRFWYNPELKSRNFLVPGSIAIIMTLIGTLLTALVISREWERGTMESLLATPVTVKEIIIGKLVPYFFLGISSMTLCFLIATLWYDVPFRGSFFALLLCSSVFLMSALGQGLLISSIAKDQFLASQIALMSAFLPAFMLSGFIFEISAMPLPIQWITHLFSVRYFVGCLQTLFLAGDIWALLIPHIFFMALIGVVFFLLTAKKTAKRLDL